MVALAALLVALAVPAHLIGDYLLQSQAMADRKVESWRWAFIHVGFYSLPHALLAGLAVALGAPAWAAVLALLVIGGTHAVIDRLRLAGRWCAWWGSWTREPGVGLWSPWVTRRDPVHDYLATWGIIVTDNTMHLSINVACLAALAVA